MGTVKRRKNDRNKKPDEHSSTSVGDGNGNDTTTTNSTEGLSDAKNNKDEEAKDDVNWKVVVTRHPLFWAIIVLGIPYLTHLGVRWVTLQHPFWNGARPAVSMNDTRQVLIVGSMSSGTSSTADGLRNEFQLEVGHEDTDTLWKFVRDGTVSWFHGIRYHEKDDEKITRLCILSYRFRSSNFGLSKTSNYGFGPTLFGSPDYSNCTLGFMDPNFRKCFINSCEKALHREFGCALDTSAVGCSTPFQTTMLQTREPWKIVKSLVAKYCWKVDVGVVKTAPRTLQWLLHIMGWANKDDHCAIQMVDYVQNYYNTILDQGGDHLQVYKVEMTTLCQIARMAGYDDDSTAVHKPNTERIKSICSQRDDSFIPKNSNVINKGRVSSSDLLQIVDETRIEQMRMLYSRLAYDYNV